MPKKYETLTGENADDSTFFAFSAVNILGGFQFRSAVPATGRFNRYGRKTIGAVFRGWRYFPFEFVDRPDQKKHAKGDDEKADDRI